MRLIICDSNGQIFKLQIGSKDNKAMRVTLIQDVTNLTSSIEESINLQCSNEVVLKLVQLRHVRLDEEASVKNLPPACQRPQVQSQGPDQPDGFGIKLNVFQVFGDRDGLSGLGNEDDERFLSRQFPQKGFDLVREIGLVRSVFENVRNPNAQGRGLRQEGFDGRTTGGQDGHLVRVHLVSDVDEGLKRK